MVKPGSTIVWSRWISAAKETLRTQYGSQVGSLERALPEELNLANKPKLTPAAVSNEENIELFRQEQMNYDEWAK